MGSVFDDGVDEIICGDESSGERDFSSCSSLDSTYLGSGPAFLAGCKSSSLDSSSAEDNSDNELKSNRSGSGSSFFTFFGFFGFGVSLSGFARFKGLFRFGFNRAADLDRFSLEGGSTV